ncbi:hypothetical protein GWI33_016376 [Rhynchophorus ferrugineus]|uniref:Uncharacterized protein n=1 Tax=Rhynchophorus ferrugineus TaxID=354439 RepID=A0A834I3M2_RHYFE|nr:hypothetical protein GWI33_016376 [Rhynchophorus ferrugineus]
MQIVLVRVTRGYNARPCLWTGSDASCTQNGSAAVRGPHGIPDFPVSNPNYCRLDFRTVRTGRDEVLFFFTLDTKIWPLRRPSLRKYPKGRFALLYFSR